MVLETGMRMPPGTTSRFQGGYNRWQGQQPLMRSFFQSWGVAWCAKVTDEESRGCNWRRKQRLSITTGKVTWSLAKLPLWGIITAIKRQRWVTANKEFSPEMLCKSKYNWVRYKGFRPRYHCWTKQNTLTYHGIVLLHPYPLPPNYFPLWKRQANVVTFYSWHPPPSTQLAKNRSPFVNFFRSCLHPLLEQTTC